MADTNINIKGTFTVSGGAVGGLPNIGGGGGGKRAGGVTGSSIYKGAKAVGGAPSSAAGGVAAGAGMGVMAGVLGGILVVLIKMLKDSESIKAMMVMISAPIQFMADAFIMALLLLDEGLGLTQKYADLMADMVDWYRSGQFLHDMGTVLTNLSFQIENIMYKYVFNPILETKRTLVGILTDQFTRLEGIFTRNYADAKAWMTLKWDFANKWLGIAGNKLIGIKNDFMTLPGTLIGGIDKIMGNVVDRLWSLMPETFKPILIAEFNRLNLWLGGVKDGFIKKLDDVLPESMRSLPAKFQRAIDYLSTIKDGISAIPGILISTSDNIIRTLIGLPQRIGAWVAHKIGSWTEDIDIPLLGGS